MAAELTVDRFLALVERSTLVSRDQMEKLVEEFSGSASDQDKSRKIAKELTNRGILTSWQVSMLLQGKYKGFILGPYHILRPLGKGGMGTVFLAEHKMLKRRCAIKVLPSGYDKEGSSLLDRFYREAQAVAALDHKNIVRAYDVNMSVENKKQIHYLVMEYVDGQDLQKMVQEKGVLDFRQAAEVIRQAADGLTHAHEAGLVHRDVKPANVLVDPNGVVKLLDLGLARFFDDAAEASLTNNLGDTVLGTADYLAPEQALNSHDVDGRADLYSLGQTLYFLLAGHPPFPTGTVAERLLAHQMKEPKPIAETRPDVPLSLMAIMAKMIAKKPDQRYQSAAEVSQALSDWLQDNTGDSGTLRRAVSLPDTDQRHTSTHLDPTRPTASSTEDTELGFAPLAGDMKSPSSSIRLDNTRGDSRLSDKKSGSQIARGRSSSQVLPRADGSQIAPGQSGSTISLAKSNIKISKSASGSRVSKSASGSQIAKSASGVGQAPPDTKPSDPLDDLELEDLDDGEDYKLDGELENLGAIAGESVEAPADVDPLHDPLAAPAPAAASSVAKKPGTAKPKAKQTQGKSQKSAVAMILDSPLFWIGIAGTVVIGLIVAIATSGSSDEEGEGLPAIEMQESAVDDKPAPSKADTKKPEEAEAEKPKPDKPADLPKSGGNRKKGPKGTGQAGKQPAKTGGGQAKPPAAGTKTPADATAVNPTGPKTPPDATEKPPEQIAKPAQPAPDPKQPAAPKPPDLKRLLAGIEDLSFKLDSFDKSADSKINLTVNYEAKTAYERINVTPSTEAPARLEVTLTGTPEDKLVRLVISGRLICEIPDSEPVTVWEHEHEIGSISPAFFQRGATVHPIVRSGIGDFFTEFIGNFRRNRAEIEAKKPAP